MPAELEMVLITNTRGTLKRIEPVILEYHKLPFIGK